MSEQSKVKHQKRYRYTKGVFYVNNVKQMTLIIRTVKIITAKCKNYIDSHIT